MQEKSYLTLFFQSVIPTSSLHICGNSGYNAAKWKFVQQFRHQGLLKSELLIPYGKIKSQSYFISQ